MKRSRDERKGLGERDSLPCSIAFKVSIDQSNWCCIKETLSEFCPVTQMPWDHKTHCRASSAHNIPHAILHTLPFSLQSKSQASHPTTGGNPEIPPLDILLITLREAKLWDCSKLVERYRVVISWIRGIKVSSHQSKAPTISPRFNSTPQTLMNGYIQWLITSPLDSDTVSAIPLEEAGSHVIKPTHGKENGS